MTEKGLPMNSAKEPVPPKPGRIKTLRQLVNGRGFGLEIGPSFQPIFPKAMGFNVETVDHASADELKKKYSGKEPAALRQIEEVDYIWRGGSLVDLIGHTKRYDYIVASHVIEHTTDLVRFLQDCSALLKSHGTLALAVPDLRYCMDFFKYPSSTGQVIEAFMEKRDRHSVATIFDASNLSCRNGGLHSWRREKPATDFRFVSEPTRAIEEAHRCFFGDEYMDAHGWHFTPSSFRLIISDLRDLKLIDLGERALFDNSGCEFQVALDKNMPQTQSRLDLAKQIRRELAAVSAG